MSFLSFKSHSPQSINNSSLHSPTIETSHTTLNEIKGIQNKENNQSMKKERTPVEKTTKRWIFLRTRNKALAAISTGCYRALRSFFHESRQFQMRSLMPLSFLCTLHLKRPSGMRHLSPAYQKENDVGTSTWTRIYVNGGIVSTTSAPPSKVYSHRSSFFPCLIHAYKYAWTVASIGIDKSIV